MNTIKNHRGFTLVEVLFAMATGIIVMGAAYVAMISGQRSSVGIEEKVVAQQDLRGGLEIMGLEIGMASYNPHFATGIWRAPGGCANVSPNQTYKGIQNATDITVTVQMQMNDILASSGIGDDANEIIVYAYDQANQRITRETNCGGAQPFLGNTVGNPRSARIINNILGIPVFRYFDGVGAEIPLANLPVSIPNIRRIEITLAFETEDVDPNSLQRRRMVYASSVVPRNHAISQ
jgi:type II secretory pathway pseudopilin PulG